MVKPIKQEILFKISLLSSNEQDTSHMLFVCGHGILAGNFCSGGKHILVVLSYFLCLYKHFFEIGPW